MTRPEIIEKQQAWRRDPEKVAAFKANLSRAMTGNDNGRGNLGKTHSEEVRARMGRAAEAYSYRGGRTFEPTEPETNVSRALATLGVEYVVHKRMSFVDGESVKAYTPDFFVPSRNLIIEVFGCYWHNCNECYDEPPRPEQLSKDERRLELMKNKHELIVVWEHDVNDIQKAAITMTRLIDQV